MPHNWQQPGELQSTQQKEKNTRYASRFTRYEFSSHHRIQGKQEEWGQHLYGGILKNNTLLQTEQSVDSTSAKWPSEGVWEIVWDGLIAFSQQGQAAEAEKKNRGRFGDEESTGV